MPCSPPPRSSKTSSIAPSSVTTLVVAVLIDVFTGHPAHSTALAVAGVCGSALITISDQRKAAR
ncbi:MAG: hypothetical protein DI580_10250 [Cutibacterium acnes]|nr:MAG: hypothetical protein DI580_10250 [Cutibacterium acnes]